MFKIVDLLRKYCLGNNLWELDIDFLNKIPTRFFFDFLIWFYLALLCNHTSLGTVSCQISWICSSTLCRKYPFIFLKPYFKSLKNEMKIIFKIIVTFMYEYVKKCVFTKNRQIFGRTLKAKIPLHKKRPLLWNTLYFTKIFEVLTYWKNVLKIVFVQTNLYYEAFLNDFPGLSSIGISCIVNIFKSGMIWNERF